MKKIINTDFDYHNDFVTPTKSDKLNLLITTNTFSQRPSGKYFDFEERNSVAEEIINSANKTTDSAINNSSSHSSADNYRAAISMLASQFIYAFVGFTHKMLFKYTVNNGVFAQMTYKYFIIAVLSKIYLNIYTKESELQEAYKFIKENKLPVFFRLLTGCFTAMAYMWSLKYLNITAVGVGVTLIPLSTYLFYNYFITKEEIKPKETIVFIVCIIFSYFILEAEEEVHDAVYDKPIDKKALGVFFLVIFILLMCGRSITQKLISKLHIVFLMYLIGIFCCFINFIFIFIFNEEVSGSILVILIMMLLGVFEFGSIVLNIYAINKGEMEFVQQFSYSFLPFTCIISFLFIGERIEPMKLASLVIIFGLNFYRSYKAYLDSKQAEEDASE